MLCDGSPVSMIRFPATQIALFLCLLACRPCIAAAAPAKDAGDLASLPLDALLDMTITGASRVSSSASETAAAVSVVTADEIRTQGWRTLADVLAGMRGVMVTSDRSYAYLGVRGFFAPGDYNTRVLLL